MRKLLYLFIFGFIFLSLFEGCKNENARISQDRDEVIMRKIGHEILLSTGNEISIVKPIIKEGNKYRIQFDADFGFPPEDIAVIIDTVFSNSHIKQSYLVKIEACETSEVVYSYEVDILSPLPVLDGLTCKERTQPKACYEVVVQFIQKKEDNSGVIIFVVLLILAACFGQFYYYNKRKVKVNKDAIKIGEYLYDAKNMLLIREEKTIELTSKESELLNVLYQSANETVERDIILNKVWGDEGDYVGRTLDVYASKLRKKLGNDASIQIKSIRGIGYKLIIEN